MDYDEPHLVPNEKTQPIQAFSSSSTKQKANKQRKHKGRFQRFFFFNNKRFILTKQTKQSSTHTQEGRASRYWTQDENTGLNTRGGGGERTQAWIQKESFSKGLKNLQTYVPVKVGTMLGTKNKVIDGQLVHWWLLVHSGQGKEVQTKKNWGSGMRKAQTKSTCDNQLDWQKDGKSEIHQCTIHPHWFTGGCCWFTLTHAWLRSAAALAQLTRQADSAIFMRLENNLNDPNLTLTVEGWNSTITSSSPTLLPYTKLLTRLHGPISHDFIRAFHKVCTGSLPDSQCEPASPLAPSTLERGLLATILSLGNVNLDSHRLRAILDEGPRSSDQWIQAISLLKSFKIGPKACRQRSKTKKWQIEAKPTLHLFWRENQLVPTGKSVLGRYHNFMIPTGSGFHKVWCPPDMVLLKILIFYTR